jgi:hypothetical protein
MISADLSVASRLAQVSITSRIERAHFAGSLLADVTSFVQARPEWIESLTPR